MNLEIGFMRHDVEQPELSQKIVDFAMSHGQPFFETCYFYLDCQCEQFIYSLVDKYPRDTYQLCGKAPILGIVENRGIEKIFEEQLSRVPGGYFDTYLLQALDSRSFIILKEQNVIPYFLKMKKEGKIKKFGLSIQCTPETFKQFLDLKCWDIVQMSLNYFDWFACRSDELYSLAKEYGLPIIAQAPMKGGLLAKQSNINVEDPTKFAFDFIKSLDLEYVLTGCSKLSTYIDTYQHLIEDDSVVKIDEELYRSKLNDYLMSTKINCIMCNRCINICQSHIPISGLIKIYNSTLDLYNPNQKANFTSFNALKKSIGEPTHLCTHCNRCTAACVFHNDKRRIWGDMFEMRS